MGVLPGKRDSESHSNLSLDEKVVPFRPRDILDVQTHRGQLLGDNGSSFQVFGLPIHECVVEGPKALVPHTLSTAQPSIRESP